MVRSTNSQESIHDRNYTEGRNSFAQEHYTSMDGKYGTAKERELSEEIKGEEPIAREGQSCDCAIKGHLCDALNDDIMIDATHVDVIVHNGVVRLLGEVDDSDAKRAAEAYARNQNGVVDVINELLVKKDFVRHHNAGVEKW